MKKTSIIKFFSFFILAFCVICCKKKTKSTLIDIKKLHHYPSASGIEYLNYQLYIIGDDANYMLILDTNLNIKDSISLYFYPGKRIQKNIKSDLEALAVIETGNEKNLLLIGSGSFYPYRNIAWLVNPVTKKRDSFQLDGFYTALKQKGILEINIEGACSLADGGFILANRGHKAYPFNYFIYTNNKFWKDSSSGIHYVAVGENKDSSVFTGVSGIAYAPDSDALILTVSTENTRSVHEDGAIGKSYIWIINNISLKDKTKQILPDRVIDLDSVDSRFKDQKIESVCVTGDTKEHFSLVLAADNDDGSSTVFKLILQNNKE